MDRDKADEIIKAMNEHQGKLKELFPPNGMPLMTLRDGALSQDQILGRLREYETGSDPYANVRHNVDEERVFPLTNRSARGQRDEVEEQMAYLLNSNIFLIPKELRPGGNLAKSLETSTGESGNG